MDEENPPLPGIKVADHANLGKSWERELETTHEWYLLQGTADIVHNPNEWTFCGAGKYQEHLKKNPAMVAQVGNGQFIIRRASNVDFSGGNGKQTFVFDAKTTNGDRFALSNVKEHQLHRLKRSARCGTTAGIMLYMSKYERVFFVPIDFLERKYERYRVQVSRHAAPGTASISMEELEAKAIEIRRHPINLLWDWYLQLSGER